MVELCDELAGEFGPAKVYNLHRARNLWTHQYAYVDVCDTIALGIVLSLEGLAAEGGWLRSDSVQVARYRDAVRSSAGAELQRTVDTLGGRGYELLGERLQRTPDHERGELLRHKSLLAAFSLRPRRVAANPRNGRARPCRMAHVATVDGLVRRARRAAE